MLQVWPALSVVPVPFELSLLPPAWLVFLPLPASAFAPRKLCAILLVHLFVLAPVSPPAYPSPPLLPSVLFLVPSCALFASGSARSFWALRRISSDRFHLSCVSHSAFIFASWAFLSFSSLICFCNASSAFLISTAILSLASRSAS